MFILSIDINFSEFKTIPIKGNFQNENISVYHGMKTILYGVNIIDRLKVKKTLLELHETNDVKQY